MEIYAKYKALLFRLAYQLTGSVADAEDAVQDVFVKVQSIDSERLQEPKAYLCRMVTNRCLDMLRSARSRREQYVGPWLPEPLATVTEDAGFEDVVQSDLLSYAMLVLLERLTPVERAVFVLREALEFDYPAIAELTGKSELNCRKLLSRARGKMGISEEELIGSEPVEEQWVSRFLAALGSGEVDTVLSMLADDAVLLSDGGGKATAAIRPIVSKAFVVKFLFGVLNKEAQKGNGTAEVEIRMVNGEPAVVIKENGIVTTIVFMAMQNGLTHHLFIVRNPDKLKVMDRLI